MPHAGNGAAFPVIAVYEQIKNKRPSVKPHRSTSAASAKAKASTAKRRRRKVARAALGPPLEHGRSAMAKGQLRSNREKKKPKTSTKHKKGAQPPSNQPFAAKPEPARVKK